MKIRLSLQFFLKERCAARPVSGHREPPCTLAKGSIGAIDFGNEIESCSNALKTYQND